MAVIDEAAIEEGLITLQVTLTSSRQPISIRQLLSTQVSRVVTIPGIIISCSRVKTKASPARPPTRPASPRACPPAPSYRAK